MISAANATHEPPKDMTMYDTYFYPSPLRIRLQQAANQKIALLALKRVPSLQFVSFIGEQSRLAASNIANQLNRYDTLPHSEIWHEATDAEVNLWLLSELRANPVGEHFCLLIHGAWVEVEADKDENWLTQLWALPEIADLYLVSLDCQTALAFLTEEYYLLAVKKVSKDGLPT